MQLSATFLMKEGEDFPRSQGYAQEQGVGILLSKLPGPWESLNVGVSPRLRGWMGSEQGSPLRLARYPS